jgi:glycerol-3-phosphate dehydrogenase subunit B
MDTQLTIVGTGIAGLAAAIFAANRGIETVLAGGSGGAGASDFSSGLIDLLGASPADPRRPLNDPWEGLDSLSRTHPRHPYARLTAEEIRGGLREVLDALQRAGLPYTGQERANSETITPAGTTKPTYRMPSSMQPGARALAEGAPCLLVDFHGLKDFSGAMVRQVLASRWPGLRSERVSFPGGGSRPELFTGVMARFLDGESLREELARTVAPLLGDAEYVGFPAVLGMYRTPEVVADLQDRLGVPVFEIPTLPPSVPGLRYKEACDRALAGSTVRRLSNRTVGVQEAGAKHFVLRLEHGDRTMRLRTRTVILASGRFLGRGLQADRTRIREPVFNLPLHQPENRQGWHRHDFFDPRGHPVNVSGLEVNSAFSPVSGSGEVVYGHLFACGSILAHQDWIRSKCGAGLSLATAFRAVDSCARLLGGGRSASGTSTQPGATDGHNR